jgi:hypothetical protein
MVAVKRSDTDLLNALETELEFRDMNTRRTV